MNTRFRLLDCVLLAFLAVLVLWIYLLHVGLTVVYDMFFDISTKSSLDK